MGQLQAAGLLAFPCRSAVTGTSVTRLEATSLPADKLMPEKASLSKRQLLYMICVTCQYRSSNPVHTLSGRLPASTETSPASKAACQDGAIQLWDI